MLKLMLTYFTPLEILENEDFFVFLLPHLRKKIDLIKILPFEPF